MKDTPAEIAKIRELCEAAGARGAVSRHWELGGEGAEELAQAVIEACEDSTEPLYDWNAPVRERIEKIAVCVYGADGVDYAPEAIAKLKRIESDPALSHFGLCMVKTHLSLSDNPTLKGVPKGWRLSVRDVLTFGGAEFIVPVSGSISLMPGTGSNPSFRRIDVDTNTGKVSGLF